MKKKSVLIIIITIIFLMIMGYTMLSARDVNENQISIITVEKLNILSDPLPKINETPTGDTFKHWKDGDKDISLNELLTTTEALEMFSPENLGPTFLNYEIFSLNDNTTAIYYIQETDKDYFSGVIQYINWSKKTNLGNYRTFMMSFVGDYSKDEVVNIANSASYKNELLSFEKELPDNIIKK